MSRGRTYNSTPEKRAQVLALLAELGDAHVVAERLGMSFRAVRHVARKARAAEAKGAQP